MICRVDAQDLDYVILFGRWHSAPAKAPAGKFYVFTKNAMNSGRRTTIAIHTVIAKPEPELEVHHKDNDGLNNKRENLVICNHVHNQREQTTLAQIEAMVEREQGRRDSRAHRYALRRTVEETGLTRQAVWNMVTGKTLKSSAYLAYMKHLAYAEGMDKLAIRSAQSEKTGKPHSPYFNFDLVPIARPA